MYNRIYGSLISSLVLLGSLSCGGESTAPGPTCRDPQKEWGHLGEIVLIGAEGGEVRSADDVAVLKIPPGAVTRTCGVAAYIRPFVEGGGAFWYERVGISGTSYRLSVLSVSTDTSRIAFAAPATFSIRYDPGLLPEGVAESDLVIAEQYRSGCTKPGCPWGSDWYYSWRNIASSRIDSVAKQVVVSIDCPGGCHTGPSSLYSGTGDYLIRSGAHHR